ncbi:MULTISPECIES: FAD-dependent oxidoreductase [unclassified Streptomyces]|jgi:thioredoxin reductase|uniref:FAD-dependent oxidoreductase n=1 Tax=unclassified Streptomyces TaxID=2593676 RepID=UPI00081B8D04|nr:MULTISPECIES: FAD-dependent oxidoreductase [unclassified Streptomyces]MYQ82533.1 FAD-dependent oxidoreductase [Streptomyces sp. SID4936]SCD43521.1 Thioredoxin reductase [Streptomyces sp. DvalAA-43]
MTRRERTVDVLIVGGGPAGLGAGAELAASGAGRVEILEREQTAGGIPRHCHHGGFGGRTIGGAGTTGPAYARGCVAAALRAGATLRTGVTVTGWAGPLTVDTTAPTGLERITARAVVLATGARERSRSARLVPGSRPPGVYTTGELQQAVHLYRQRIGSRAVVIGDEPISHAAADTLRVAGLEVVAMVTDRAPARLAVLTRGGDRAPVLGRTTVTALTGRERLTGVSVRHHDGRTATLRCDTVVFTGDWIPEHELARRAGVALDPGTRGPAHDAAHRTSGAGVFAVGNLLHGVESAGFALAEGRAVAAPVLRHLATGEWPTGRPSVAVDPPLRWIAPNLVGPDGELPLDGRFTLRTTRRLASPLLVVRQDGRELHRQRLLLPVVPDRPFRLRAGWLDRVDPYGGPVRISVC